MALMPSDTNSASWLDSLLESTGKVVGSYLDNQTAKSNAEAAQATRDAEQAKANYIEQLAKYATTSGQSVADALSNTPSWLLSAAVLGFGGLLFYRLAKK